MRRESKINQFLALIKDAVKKSGTGNKVWWRIIRLRETPRMRVVVGIMVKLMAK